MTGIPGIAALGFIIGLTGALAPGPTLVAAIRAAVKGGWTAGPKVTFGHMLVEVLMVGAIAGGMSGVLTGCSALLAVAGGSALILFGLLTMAGARHARIESTEDGPHHTEPVIAGFVTSIGNPYFWIWWLTVGSALLIGALEGGIFAMIAFIAGHWAADLGWYTLVAAGIHRGRFFLGTREYRVVLVICGVFLVAFGAYYLATAGA